MDCVNMSSHQAANNATAGESSKVTPRLPLCVFCGQTFSCHSDLLEHVVIHKKEKPFECSFCDMRYKDFYEFSNHLRTLHSKRPFCLKVGEVAYSNGDGERSENLTVEDLLNNQTVRSSTQYRCTFCSETLSQQHQFLTHVKQHMGKTYQCHFCEKRFPRDDLRQKHLKRVHVQRLASKKAQTALGDFNSIWKDLSNKDGVKDKATTGGETDPVLDIAIIRIVGDGSVLLMENKEDECQNNAIDSDPIENPSLANVQTRPAKESTEVQCTVCGKTFHNKHNYEEHALIHTGEKPYACVVCDLRYRQRSAVIRHVKNAHKDFRCGKAFKKVGDLAADDTDIGTNALGSSESVVFAKNDTTPHTVVVERRCTDVGCQGSADVGSTKLLSRTECVLNTGDRNNKSAAETSGGFVDSGTSPRSVIRTAGFTNTGSGRFIHPVTSTATRPVPGTGGFVDGSNSDVLMSVVAGNSEVFSSDDGSVRSSVGSGGLVVNTGTRSVADAGEFVGNAVVVRSVARTGGLVNPGEGSIVVPGGLVNLGEGSIVVPGGLVNPGERSIVVPGGLVNPGEGSIVVPGGLVNPDNTNMSFVRTGDLVHLSSNRSIVGNRDFVNHGTRSGVGTGGLVNTDTTKSIVQSGRHVDVVFRSGSGNGVFADNSVGSVVRTGALNPDNKSVVGNGECTNTSGRYLVGTRGLVNPSSSSRSVLGPGSGLVNSDNCRPSVGSGEFVDNGAKSVAENGGLVIRGSGEFGVSSVRSVVGVEWHNDMDNLARTEVGNGGLVDNTVQSVGGSGGFVNNSVRSTAENRRFVKNDVKYDSGNGESVDCAVRCDDGNGGLVKPTTRCIEPVAGSVESMDAHGRETDCDDEGDNDDVAMEPGEPSHSADDTKILPCTFCSEKFPDKSLLQKHVLIHAFENLYACQLCEMRFAHHDTLDNHVKTDHEGCEEIKAVTEPLCVNQPKSIRDSFTYTEGVFLKKDVLLKRSDSQSEEREVKRAMSKESKKVKVKGLYRRTIRNRGGGSTGLRQNRWRHAGSRPFQCEICGKQFRLNVHLKEHVHEAHPECSTLDRKLAVSNSKCDNTVKSDRLSNVSSSYKRRKTSGKMKNYECTLCNEVFVRKSELVKHTRQHASGNSKPFRCELCHASFVLSSSLSQHVRHIHTGCPVHKVTGTADGQRKDNFVGENWTVGATNDESDENHREGSTNRTMEAGDDNNVSNNDKRMVKNEDRADDKRMCRRRRKKSEELKMFSCKLCDRVFKKACYLLNHMKRHTSGVMFPCKVFKMRQHLENHTKKRNDRGKETQQQSAHTSHRVRNVHSQYSKGNGMGNNNKKLRKRDECPDTDSSALYSKSDEMGNIRNKNLRKRHACTACGKVVRDVKSHMMTVHDKDLPAKCDYCPIRFKKAEERRTHEMAVHNQRSLPPRASNTFKRTRYANEIVEVPEKYTKHVLPDDAKTVEDETRLKDAPSSRHVIFIAYHQHQSSDESGKIGMRDGHEKRPEKVSSASREGMNDKTPATAENDDDGDDKGDDGGDKTDCDDDGGGGGGDGDCVDDDHENEKSNPKKDKTLLSCTKDRKIQMLKKSSRNRCNVCFKRCLDVRKHMRTHATDRPIQCDYCHYRFRHFHSYRRHVRAVHSEHTPPTCKRPTKLYAVVDPGEACTEDVPSKSPGRETRISHLNAQISSQISDTKLTTADAESANSNTMMAEAEKDTTEGCIDASGSNFTSTNWATTHVAALRTGVKRNGRKRGDGYQCPTCGKTFTQERIYTEHTRSHSGERPHTCHDCGKSFNYLRNVRRHVLYVHTLNARYKTFRENIMETREDIGGDADAQSQSGPRYRAEMGGGDDVASTYCAEMGDGSDVASTKDEERKVSHDNTPCRENTETTTGIDSCGDAALSLSGDRPVKASGGAALTIDRRLKREGSTKQDCDYDDDDDVDDDGGGDGDDDDGGGENRTSGISADRSKANSNSEVDTWTSEQRKPHKKGERFHCRACNKTFPQQRIYQEHMRSHTGERPHQCDHCDKSFNYYRNVKRHMLTVHGFVISTSGHINNNNNNSSSSSNNNNNNSNNKLSFGGEGETILQDNGGDGLTAREPSCRHEEARVDSKHDRPWSGGGGSEDCQDDDVDEGRIISNTRLSMSAQSQSSTGTNLEGSGRRRGRCEKESKKKEKNYSLSERVADLEFPNKKRLTKSKNVLFMGCVDRSDCGRNDADLHSSVSDDEMVTVAHNNTSDGVISAGSTSTLDGQEPNPGSSSNSHSNSNRNSHGNNNSNSHSNSNRNSNSNSNSHGNNNGNSSQQNKACTICGKSFFSKDYLKEHMTRHTGHKPFKCLLCDRRFNFQTSASRHVRVVHKGCDHKDIGGGTRMKSSGNRGGISVGPECDAATPFKCYFCDQAFRNAAIRYRHARKCHKGSVIPKTSKSPSMALCAVCGKLCAPAYTLKYHMVKHGDTRPYQCTACPSRFKTKHSLAQHVKCKHKYENDENGFPDNAKAKVKMLEELKCSVCNKSFPGTQQSRFEEHLRSHSRETPFKCDFCHVKFKYESSIKAHLRARNSRGGFCPKQSLVRGEKKFECSVCGTKVSRKLSLARHMMIHSGEKPYGCQYCGVVFRWSSTFRRHVRVVHKGLPVPQTGQSRVTFQCKDRENAVEGDRSTVDVSSIPNNNKNNNNNNIIIVPENGGGLSNRPRCENDTVVESGSGYVGLDGSHEIWSENDDDGGGGSGGGGDAYMGNPERTSVPLSVSQDNVPSLAYYKNRGQSASVYLPVNGESTDQTSLYLPINQNFTEGSPVYLPANQDIVETSSIHLPSNQSNTGSMPVHPPTNQVSLQKPSAHAPNNETSGGNYIPANIQPSNQGIPKANFNSKVERPSDNSIINTNTTTTNTSNTSPVNQQCRKSTNTNWRKQRESSSKREWKYDKMLPCTYCGKMFRRCNLPEHVLRHTGEKPHQCHLCRERYRQRSALLRHLKNAHGVVRRKLDVLFGDKNAGRNDVEEALRRKGTKNGGRLGQIFQCVFCDRKCYGKQEFQEHVRSHTGEVPYQCDFCHARYKYLSSIRRHLKIKESRGTCPIFRRNRNPSQSQASLSQKPEKKAKAKVKKKE